MRNDLPVAWRRQPKSDPPELNGWWDENKPVGTILGPDGSVLKRVMPNRRPIGFQHPKCGDNTGDSK